MRSVSKRLVRVEQCAPLQAEPKEILRGFIDLDARLEWDELCIGATLYEAAHPSARGGVPPVPRAVLGSFGD